jgi:hypothetical protein
MFSSSKIFTAFFALVLVFSANAAVYADTIKLKDGSVIKGKIVDFKNQQITVVRTGSNNRASNITVEADDVESIEFDSIENLQALINIARPNVSASTTFGNTNNSEVAANVGNSTNNQPVSATLSRSTQSSTPTNASNASTVRPNVNQPVPPTTGGLSQVINAQPTSTTNQRSVTSGNGRFIPLSVKVLADNTANGWTNTGLVVKKGQRIRISSNGRISLGGGKFATPAGIGSVPDEKKLMLTEPTGALIAVIGDDNNDFIFIGSNRDFEAQRDGTLFLGINEGNLNDNSGAFETTVEAQATDATAQK